MPWHYSQFRKLCLWRAGKKNQCLSFCLFWLIICITNVVKMHEQGLGQWLPMYIPTQQYLLSFLSPPTFILTSTISLSSNMLTCKTPPNAVPSKQPVKLTVDSVERSAPVLFTYNQDPIINSIQPSRSFIRLESHLFREGFSVISIQSSVHKVLRLHLCGDQHWTAYTVPLGFLGMVWISLFVNVSDYFLQIFQSCVFLHLIGGTRERT